MGRHKAGSQRETHGWRCHNNQKGRFHSRGLWCGVSSPGCNNTYQLLGKRRLRLFTDTQFSFDISDNTKLKTRRGTSHSVR